MSGSIPFFNNKPPKPPVPANTPISADATAAAPQGDTSNIGSLITTGPSGLQRKAATQKTSLIGGGA